MSALDEFAETMLGCGSSSRTGFTISPPRPRSRNAKRYTARPVELYQVRASGVEQVGWTDVPLSAEG
jgi:hypothetical protein